MQLTETIAQTVTALTDQPSKRQTAITVGVAGLIPIGIVILQQLFGFFEGAWWIYSTIVGVLLGMIAGGAFVRSVSRGFRAGVIGVFLGLGADWISAANTDTGVTLIARATDAVKAAALAATDAASSTGIMPIPWYLLVIGIWMFIFTFGLVLCLDLWSTDDGDGG